MLGLYHDGEAAGPDGRIDCRLPPPVTHASLRLVQMRALPDGISHHAINPKRGEEKRQPGKDREQCAKKSAACVAGVLLPNGPE